MAVVIFTSESYKSCTYHIFNKSNYAKVFDTAVEKFEFIFQIHFQCVAPVA
jgi:hypothetical protein